MADTDKRTYSDPSYGGHRIITFGGISGATQTLATNGVYACHQFMFPARVLGATLKHGGNGIDSGMTGGSCTEFQVLKSTDSGTGVEADPICTFDPLMDTGTHLMEDAALSLEAGTVTETNFDAGDFVILSVKGDWDDPMNFSLELEVIEKFQNADN